MKLSTKGRYGLRAMIDLARYSEKEPGILKQYCRTAVSVRGLSGTAGGHAEKKQGWWRGIRGAQGGYVLAKDPSDISVGDILRALEGNLEPVRCAAFYSEEGCQAADGCVTKYVWQKINDSINDTVNHIMLDELVRESRKVNPAGECKGPQCSRT